MAALAIGALGVALSTHPSAASPATITVDASADARIDSTQPQVNLDELNLRVDASPEIDSLIAFTVQGVGDAGVGRALLWLHVTEGSTSGGVVTSTDSGWNERSVKWATAPPRGPEVARMGAVTAGTDVAVDVTSVVTGDGSYGFRLYSPDGDGASYQRNEALTSPPRLELTLADAMASGSPSPTAAPTGATATPAPTDTPSPTVTTGASPSPAPSPTPTSPSPAPTASPTPSAMPTPTPTPVPPPASSGVPVFDHIFVVVEENKSYSQIIGSSSAPYINSLANDNAVATDYHGITHPSLPNYLALMGGQTFGITTDCSPSSCPVNGANLADSIEGVQRGWGAYMESMPDPCTTTSSGSYAVKHNPFVYFDDIRTNPIRCNAHVVPYSDLGADLATTAATPSFVFIVPNLCNDMHDCSISTGDNWLKANLPTIFDSPAWKTQNSLLVITWDEDDFTTVNKVATIMIGPSVRPGYRSSTTYNHYSLLKTIEASWGLPPLTKNDANASTMSEFFR